MKNKFYLLMLASTLFFNAASAQTDNEKVLMTIGNEKVTLGEFLNVYHKNNANKSNDQKSLNEYLDLYVNFRMKVREAKENGYDTTDAFKTELDGYRKQLSVPYLTDTVVNDNIIKEAYDRLQWDVRASHILIKCDADALPKDTLKAYQKALSIYNRILKGEKFEDIANKESEDPYVKQQVNGGDLGYFTALIGYVYPFESAAYKLKVNEMSKPVRTQFGYHIIKLTDKVKHEEMMVSHIMVRFKANMTKEDSALAKKKIFEVYEKLKADSVFAIMANKYSEDPASAKKNGELPVLSRTSNYPPEFKTNAYKLSKDGMFTEPFITRFGWHIVKRHSVKPVASFEEMKMELKAKVSKDQRSNITRTVLLNKIKKWYGFKEDALAKKEMIGVLDSAIFNGQWKAEKASKMSKVIFSIGDKKVTQAQFAKFMEERQVARTKVAYEVVINNFYSVFLEETLVAYEESKLDAKYPRFKALMEEYRDGILLFELTDKKVWSKAVKDTAGARAYHEKNKNKWMWDERAEAKFYTCVDEKTAQKVKDLIKKNKTDKDILTALNKKDPNAVKIEERILMKGDNKLVDANWTPGVTPNINESGKFVFANVTKIVPQKAKTYEEAKGLVTADYQNYLEKEWIESLKKKYEVKIDQDVVKLIK